MEFRKLEYFWMVCRERNITKAAACLQVSQPSVTIGIRKLEEELGVKLLERGTRKITITQEGKVFLQRTEEMLTRREAAITEMRDLKKSQAASLRVGITAIMGTVLFPSAFARFRKDHPHIQVTVIEEGSLAVRSRLERGELDLGIMITSDLPQTLQSVTVSSDRIMVCLPCDHPLGQQDSLSLNELRDEPFILLQEDTYSRQIILEACSKLGFRPKVVLASSQMGTALELVRRKVGISFFAKEVLKDQQGILARPLSEPLFLTAGLAWNRNGYLSKAAKAFLHSFQHS